MMLVQEASECPGKDVGIYIEGFIGERTWKDWVCQHGRERIEEGGKEAETREEVTELVGLAQHGVYLNLMLPSFLFSVLFGALLHRAAL